MPDLLTYCKLEKELRMRIISGFLPDYHRIHSEKILAARYGICRNSVRKALDILEKEGLIFRKKGSGTFVVPTNERKHDFPVSEKSGNVILYLTFSLIFQKKLGYV